MQNGAVTQSTPNASGCSGLGCLDLVNAQFTERTVLEGLFLDYFDSGPNAFLVNQSVVRNSVVRMNAFSRASCPSIVTGNIWKGVLGPISFGPTCVESNNVAVQ